jgi:hypothetical protein
MRKKILPPPPLTFGEPKKSDIPLQPFENTEEIWKDPKGLTLDNDSKRVVLEKLEEAYLQAWMSQKVVEITYQRILHDFYNRGGLVKEKLQIELAQTQNEMLLAELMLKTIYEWKEQLK